MKIIVLLLVALFVVGFAKHPITEEMVSKINNAKLSWKAKPVNENKLAHMPEEKLKGLLGTKLDSAGILTGRGKPQPPPSPEANSTCTVTNAIAEAAVSSIPNFNASEKWPGKIHPIRDQGICGSCWAYGAANAYSDRRHILTGDDLTFSPQFLIDCDSSNFGCNGGYLDRVWTFMNNTGIPTDTCQPETSSFNGLENTCDIFSCTDGSGDSVTYYHSGEACGGYDNNGISILTVSKIKYEMMTNGPVELAFSVYEDFMNYGSGVYQHTYGSYLGGHAIKCFGWGSFTTGGGKKTKTYQYWMCANQWGTGWGDNGYFNILMGDCGINDNGYFAAALADITPPSA